MPLQISDWLLSPHDCPGFLEVEPVAEHKSPGGGRSLTSYLHVNIPRRYGLVNITSYVERLIQQAEITDGLCFVSAMHITAGIYINDAESGLLQDIATWIENLAPFGKNYLHHETGEDNADAHLKSFLTNPSATLPITYGKLDFGTWQQVFYAEFDGLRKKRILVKVFGF